MANHFPPADPHLTFDATLSDAAYRAYHRLLAQAWNHDTIRQLALTKSDLLALLGCSHASLYVHLKNLVSHGLIAYHSADGRTVITFKNKLQEPGQNGKANPDSWTESRILDSNGHPNPEIQIPGQVDSPAPLKELINTVVVVDPPQKDQLLLLGKTSPENWTPEMARWPVHEICDAAGVYPNRRPGQQKWVAFVAWLIYGYQHKAETRGEGIVSPALYAITRLEMQPAPLYLEIALAGPLACLDAMDNLIESPWSEILAPAKKNGLYPLLDPFFPIQEDEQD